MRWPLWMVAAATTLSGTALAPAPVKACGHAVEARMDTLVAELSRAERDVDAGRSERAARVVLTQYPTLRQMKPARRRVSDWAMRIMALAIVRSDAKIDLKPGFAGETETERAANLEWAQRLLRGFSQRSGRDAAAETAYAEAIALSPQRRGEAKRILDRLARTDLVTSPQGYAALARLYAPVVEEGAPRFLHAARSALSHGRRRLADARCRRMAAEAEVCGAPLRSPDS